MLFIFKGSLRFLASEGRTQNRSHSNGLERRGSKFFSLKPSIRYGCTYVAKRTSIIPNLTYNCCPNVEFINAVPTAIIGTPRTVNDQKAFISYWKKNMRKIHPLIETFTQRKINPSAENNYFHQKKHMRHRFWHPAFNTLYNQPLVHASGKLCSQSFPGVPIACVFAENNDFLMRGLL